MTISYIGGKSFSFNTYITFLFVLSSSVTKGKPSSLSFLLFRRPVREAPDEGHQHPDLPALLQQRPQQLHGPHPQDEQQLQHRQRPDNYTPSVKNQGAHVIADAGEQILESET